jgi:Spy/CpxP family protein refolding chaperone
MIRWLLWLALALSLLFNVFFAAGYLMARSATGDETAVPGQVTKALDLDDAQTAEFEHLRATYHTERAVWDEQFMDLAAQLTTELARDEPNPEKLREILSRRADLEGERHRARAQHFSNFISTLDPEQCRRLAERMQHEVQGHRRRRFDQLRRFDENGDGELDEAERRAARAAMERNRGDWQREHQERTERFDANGDGELDDEEREAMRTWMRENRRGRAGSGPGPGPGRGPGRGPGGPRRP